jgi:hypothetical protein
MWIDNRIARPLRKGRYKTLVTQDEWGTLKEENNELFNGTDWCIYESHAQFVTFWWATNEERNEIFDRLEKERDGK